MRTPEVRVSVRASGAAFEELRISILWASFAILLAAVVFDLRSRQIPDTLSVCLLLLAVTATGFHLHPVPWLDLCLGLLTGFSAGLFLFWLGGFGGGDVKLISSLGAVVGFKGELGVMFYIAIAGGICAIAARIFHQRDFPYAPAIAFGLLAFIVRGYFP
jgi:Flp pilus assembly protein protease CpaA